MEREDPGHFSPHQEHPDRGRSPGGSIFYPADPAGIQLQSRPDHLQTLHQGKEGEGKKAEGVHGEQGHQIRIQREDRSDRG